jgi:hypothetical protein
MTTGVKSERQVDLAGLAVFLISFLLYWITLAPTLLWSDSAKLALAVNQRQFAATGFGAHPMHTVIGYLFSLLPFSLAYSQNLMSAFFASGTVYMVYLIIRLETGEIAPAILASTALTVSHLFWMYAVINETYSLLAFCLTAVIYFVLRWNRKGAFTYLFLAAFLFGAGFADHGMMLIFLPGILLLMQREKLLELLRPMNLLFVTLMFLAGASPVLIFPLFAGSSLRSLISALLQTTQQHYETFSSTRKMFRQVLIYPLYLVYQFPTLGFLPALYYVVHHKKASSKLFTGTMLIWAVTVLFASQYFLQRQFPMLIPSFLIVAIWSGLGLSLIFHAFPSWKRPGPIFALFFWLAIIPPVVYYLAYRTAEARRTDIRFIRPLPYRNTYRYFLYPPKCMERGAEQYARDAFLQAESNAIILSDFNPGMALLYAQEILGQRKDLKIRILIDDWIHQSPDPGANVLQFVRENIGRGSVLYLADNYEPYYHSSRLSGEFRLDRGRGPLWKVTKKDE